MPNLIERLAKNAPGAFYVDASCIDCDQCRNIAPEFFSRHEELGLSIVHRQPTTPDEIALAQDALDTCPTNSIGNDGASL
jgi:ferredoxin